MRMNFSVPVIALIGGVAIGYCFRGGAKVEEVDSGESAVGRHHEMIADKGEDASLQALRDRVKELEAEVKKYELFSEAVSNTPTVAEAQPVREERRREGFRDRIERMKKENPEQYAQMTNDMRRWRDMRKERAQSKIDLLDSYSSRGLLAGNSLENADALKNLLASREEIEEKIHREDLSDEEREATMRSMFETDGAIGDMNEQVRQDLFAAVAKDLGFSDEDSRLVVEELNTIIEATNGGFGGPPGGGPRGPRGGGRRGR
ncbi:MAG: hypothetical protein IJQ34_02325 [Kiritimatiellae bacterium]|nr:hypothetical protein [Kiritimatiellia bacterium]